MGFKTKFLQTSSLCFLGLCAYGVSIRFPIDSESEKKFRSQMEKFGYKMPTVIPWKQKSRSEAYGIVGNIVFEANIKGDLISLTNSISSDRGTPNPKFIAKIDTWRTQTSKELPTPPKGLIYKKLHDRRDSDYLPISQIPEKDRTIYFISYTLADKTYPTYFILGISYRFSLITGQLVTYSNRRRNPYISRVSKIEASEAIQVARACAARVRKAFPRAKGVAPIVGPNSPQKVIHIQNTIWTDAFINEAKRQQQLKPQVRIEPWDQYGLPDIGKVPMPLGTSMALSWLVNINGDIVVVNAETGHVQYFQYAESGPYFTINKDRSLEFTRK